MRRPPYGRHPQRGAASVVIAILFLVIAGYAAVVALDMTTVTVSDASLSEAGAQAQFLAESGLERGFQRFKAGTVSCAGVGPNGPYTLNGGQFRIVSGVLQAPGNVNCRITAVGQMGNAKRQISAVAKPGGYDFLEPFPSSTDYANSWTASLAGGSRGGDDFSADNCNTCTSATGGSLWFWTRGTGNNDRYRGYVQRNLNTPLNSQTGITVQVNLGYKKAAVNGRADVQGITVRLISSATGNSVTLWSHTAISNAQAWVAVNQTAVLPANQIYDRLRVDMDLQEDGNRQVQIWIDEIRVRYP